MKDNPTVTTPDDHPRAGWDPAFAAMALRGDDALLDRWDLPPTVWDQTEWIWE